MKFVIILAVVLVGVVILLALVKIQSSPEAKEDTTAKGSDYEALRSVLSPTERAYLGLLASFLPPGVGVLVKIRLADIFTAKRSLNSASRQAAFSRIQRKHIDFLLVRADDFSPLAGIELDEGRPTSPGAQQHRRFVESLFAKSGLPLMRVQAQEEYHAEEMRQQVSALLASLSRPS